MKTAFPILLALASANSEPLSIPAPIPTPALPTPPLFKPHNCITQQFTNLTTMDLTMKMMQRKLTQGKEEKIGRAHV